MLSACREALDEAFAGTDCVFHLGGQVNLDAVQADAAGVLAQAENAYVRGDEAQAGMLEDRAMQRLRDAYRTHWNLPGTREVLSRGGRVMVPGDADLGRTLLRNSTEGYVRRTLRRMTQRVYREYQRQLWEPLLPTAVTFTVLMRALSEQPDRRKQARFEAFPRDISPPYLARHAQGQQRC